MSQIADSVQKEDEFACSTTGNVAERNAPEAVNVMKTNTTLDTVKRILGQTFLKEDKYEWHL